MKVFHDKTEKMNQVASFCVIKSAPDLLSVSGPFWSSPICPSNPPLPFSTIGLSDEVVHRFVCGDVFWTRPYGLRRGRLHSCLGINRFLEQFDSPVGFVGCGTFLVACELPVSGQPHLFHADSVGGSDPCRIDNMHQIFFICFFNSFV